MRPCSEQVHTLTLSPQCSLTDEAPTEGQQVIIPEVEPGTRRPGVMVDPDIDEDLDADTNADANTNVDADTDADADTNTSPTKTSGQGQG